MSLGTLTWATMNVICWKSLIRCCREDNQKRKLFAMPPRASRGNPSLNTCSQTFTIKCFNISSIWNNLNVIWICDFNKRSILNIVLRTYKANSWRKCEIDNLLWKYFHQKKKKNNFKINELFRFNVMKMVKDQKL